MQNFEYSCPTEIVFGENRAADAGDFCAKAGARKVLVAYGGDYLKKSGLLDKILGSIKKNGLEWTEFSDVVPNPTIESVEEGYKLFKESGCDFILSIGGGSAIDTGKAIALCCAAGSTQQMWDRVFLNFEMIDTPVKSGVVLTTAASGSETGESCVITNGNRKLIGTSPALRPAFAILDPVTLLTLPPFQTACGAADVLSHLEERYFTNVTDNDLTDRFLEGAMRLVIQTGELLMDNPGDMSLRSQLMWIATLGHNGLLDRGRNFGDWACHSIEHEISARFPVVHGEGIAMITPSWLSFAAKRPECRNRMLQFATRVWGAEFPNDDDKNIALAIRRQKQWYKQLKLRTGLKNVEGFTKESAKEIAGAFDYNPGLMVSLDKEAILSILEEAMKDE